MADPDVIYSESSSKEIEEADTSHSVVDGTTESEPYRAQSEGFPDLSSFVEEREGHELDAMFANRFTMDDDLYAEVSNGFPKSVVIYPWASRPKRNYDYIRRQDGVQEDGEPRNKRWHGRDDGRKSGSSWQTGSDGDYRSYRGRDGDWRKEGGQDCCSEGRRRGQPRWRGNRRDRSGP